MASIISAGTTSGTALNMVADTTGVLQLATGATPTTAVTIDTSQNVGIGTTSPTGKFTVSGGNLDVGGTASPLVRIIENTGTGNPKLQLLDINNYTSPTEGTELWYESNTGNSYLTSLFSGGGLIFRTGGTTERMRIDSSGRVTMPYQPAFSASKTASATSADALVTFTNAIVNIGSYYSTANSRFTAPVAGTYYFLFDGLTNNNGDTGDARFYKNGADTKFTIYSSSVGGTSYKKTVGSAIITLASNDYIEVRTIGSQTFYGDTTNYHTRFLGYLIG